MKLPKGFINRRITKKNLEMLKKHRDDDEELCTDPQVWKDLFDEQKMTKDMESVLVWIEPSEMM